MATYFWCTVGTDVRMLHRAGLTRIGFVPANAFRVMVRPFFALFFRGFCSGKGSFWVVLCVCFGLATGCCPVLWLPCVSIPPWSVVKCWGFDQTSVPKKTDFGPQNSFVRAFRTSKSALASYSAVLLIPAAELLKRAGMARRLVLALTFAPVGQRSLLSPAKCPKRPNLGVSCC